MSPPSVLPLVRRRHLRRRPVAYGILLITAVTACNGGSSVGLEDGDDPILADTLAAPAGTLASAAVARVSYEPRAEDFSADHPDHPGTLFSFNTLVLTLEPLATVGQVNALLKDHAAEIVGAIPGEPGVTGSILVLRLPTGTHAEMEAALATLRGDAVVAAAVQDAGLVPLVLPNPTNASGDWKDWDDAPDGGNWGLEAVDAPFLWNLTKAVGKRGAFGQRLVVLDAGFKSHADLSFINRTPGAVDDHGTAVAGVAGATWGNELGIDGIDPFVSIIGSAQSENLATAGSNKSWAASILDDLEGLIRSEFPQVVNVSLGFAWEQDTNSDTDLQQKADDAGEAVFEMLETLQEQGFRLPVITQASGNESGLTFGDQPARYGSPLGNAALVHGAANIIVVGGTAKGETRYSRSNPGGHISAPADNILVLNVATGSSAVQPYVESSGTSFAAPLVGGLATYLYTLAPDLGPPTLSSNPILDILDNSGLSIPGGSPKQIDAFAAALDTDRVLGNQKTLRLLVDMDDGSPDGNLRLDPLTGNDVSANFDLDIDGGIGDSIVDMSDFRVWRDGYVLVTLPEGAHGLDGAAQSPKKDLNRNGVFGPGPGGEDGRYARMDLNGDRLIDPETSRMLPGAVDGSATDLDVLAVLFDDPHYDAADLPGLAHSGDIVVHPEFVLGHPKTVLVQSFLDRVADGVPVDERVHVGPAPGNGPYQIYTAAVEPNAATNEYRAKLEALDASANVIFTDTLTFDLLSGADHYWDPQCAVDPQGQPTGHTGRGALCVDVQITQQPGPLQGGEQGQFSATVTGASDTSVTWTAQGGGGSISPSGLYTAPVLAPGASVTETVVATSVEEPLVRDTAFVVVTQSGGRIDVLERRVFLSLRATAGSGPDFVEDTDGEGLDGPYPFPDYSNSLSVIASATVDGEVNVASASASLDVTYQYSTAPTLTGFTGSAMSENDVMGADAGAFSIIQTHLIIEVIDDAVNFQYTGNLEGIPGRPAYTIIDRRIPGGGWETPYLYEIENSSFNETGALEPGVYRIRIAVSTNSADSSTGSFDFSFQVVAPIP